MISLNLLALSACKPRPFGLEHAPANADPAFKRGFDHGCETGLAGFGNSFYKTFYSFKKDMLLRDNPLYINGWDKGYQYCRQYSLKWNFEAIDKY